MRRKGSGQPVVALVGYTNAGKSTLLNTLAHADIYVADLLFATLDPTTRQVVLPGGKAVLITDTVGFIQKLPASLIAAFRATLEEIAEADLLLHIVDISHPNAREQVQSVHQTLRDLGLEKIPMITGINKIDKLSSPPDKSFPGEYPNTILLSAKTGLGIANLLQSIENVLYQEMNPILVKIPFSAARLLDLLHREGSVDSVTHKPDGIVVSGRIPGAWLSEFRPFIQNNRSEKE
jgi:GTP-binding protein HflX